VTCGGLVAFPTSGRVRTAARLVRQRGRTAPVQEPDRQIGGGDNVDGRPVAVERPGWLEA